ncbi:MAG: outer membrane lipoprotein carrier protein LolA [Smithellaceae bacterium]|jgi:outer membrane lipoprotein carrier protein
MTPFFDFFYKKISRNFLKPNEIVRAITTLFWLIAALFLIMSLPGSVLAEELPLIDDVVQKLQHTYEKTEDFKANFLQETTIKSIKKTEIEEGSVFFKNPKNMLWDYTKPRAKKLVINQRTAWLYLPQEKTAYKQKAENVFQSKALIRFLSGLGKLKDDFSITYAEPKALDNNGNYLLLLTPLEKNTILNPIRITVDKSKFYILQVNFDDVLGNSTSVKFSNIFINNGLTDKMFQFQPPAGVSIFDMP